MSIKEISFDRRKAWLSGRVENLVVDNNLLISDKKVRTTEINVTDVDYFRGTSNTTGQVRQFYTYFSERGLYKVDLLFNQKSFTVQAGDEGPIIDIENDDAELFFCQAQEVRVPVYITTSGGDLAGYLIYKESQRRFVFPSNIPAGPITIWAFNFSVWSDTKPAALPN